jgi:hypothetical protein
MNFIKAIGKIFGSTVQDSFVVYDTLFNHIKVVTDKLIPKKRKWKTKL